MSRLYKTAAYAVVTVSVLTALGHIARFCQGNCRRSAGASIAFGVFSTLVALTMLVLWFIMSELAETLEIYLVHALFLFVIIATATGALEAGNDLANLANYTALLVTTLIVVHAWNMFVDAVKGEGEEEEEEEAAPEPENSSQTYTQTRSMSQSNP